MRPAEIAALQQALSTVTRDPQIQQRLWQAMCDAVYAIEFNGLHTESADDGECRSCVAGKCVTGPECVTLGRDDTQAPAATEAPSDKAATITGLIAQIRAAKSMARRDALFEKIIEVWEATPAPAATEAPTLREACAALLSLIRRDAPHLSGKVLGEAEAALAAVGASREPTGDQLRQIARSARTSASDPASPTELVLAGWKAAVGASVQPVQASLSDEPVRLALDALEEIALAGMSGTGQESEEGMRAWHARRAWEFIAIAARARDEVRTALATKGGSAA